MSRILSTSFKQQMNAAEMSDVLIALLEIHNDQLEEYNPLLICQNTEDVTSNGKDYTAMAFDIILPAETEDTIPTTTLEIDNVDRKIVEAARMISDDTTIVYLSLVLASDPDVIEIGPFEFALYNVTYNKFKVSGTLSYLDVLSDKFPKDSIDPEFFPAAY